MMLGVSSQFFFETNQLPLTSAGLNFTVVASKTVRSSVLSSGHHARDVFIIYTVGCSDQWDWSIAQLFF